MFLKLSLQRETNPYVFSVPLDAWNSRTEKRMYKRKAGPSYPNLCRTKNASPIAPPPPTAAAGFGLLKFPYKIYCSRSFVLRLLSVPFYSSSSSLSKPRSATIHLILIPYRRKSVSIFWARRSDFGTDNPKTAVEEWVQLSYKKASFS